MLSSASIIVLAASALAGLLLFQPRLTRSRTWRAVVTPLASIIGSGFLILAPILLREFGAAAPAVMAGLCAVAWCVGAAIRWNILHADQDTLARASFTAGLDRGASWLLALAYVITVAYYLNLFGAFAVSLTNYDAPLYGRIVTSLALLSIAVVGWLKGFRGLELVESLSVGVKLTVIAGLLAGLGWYAWGLEPSQLPANTSTGALNLHSLQVALGLLITVQGFETSRYLGGDYRPEERVRTMRHAQGLSTAIYVSYLVLATLAFPADSVGTRETAVVDMMRVVAPILPGLLVLAALSAQVSAAVADTNGCGGLVHRMSGRRIPGRVAYLGLVAAGLAMTWTANVFEIISYASRAFALYYALQCALAACLCGAGQTPKDWLRRLAFGTLAAGCAAAAVFGVPAEGGG